MDTSMILEWWHWEIAGLALVLLELAVPSFFIIWFGLGAMLTGLVLLAVPDMVLASQIATWVIASMAMTVLWFSVARRSRFKTLIGTAAGEVIGEVGLLVSAVAPFERGKVRFQRPVLGADEWACVAETAIAAGERVRVVSVEGSYVKVAKA
ncbi:NfeD family protein [Thauera sp.]|jgi:membrane protein implicated in regulation of membrane protease activity|uniref:NfeD family protein n=1 Tax=Thauera sp. TaxID=1905334 RepID=UPI002612154E|nr:NfeD family protein [Thauera sp.]MCK6408450.1 NfeD family protein [Thauera sp.]